MSDVFRVAVHYGSDNGFIEYNPETKKVTVYLKTAYKRREAEEYLTSKQRLRAAQKTLVDFKEWQAVPTDSLENFKLALTRLWENTEVYVDWSRPVKA